MDNQEDVENQLTKKNDGFLRKCMPSVFPAKEVPKDLWKFDNHDKWMIGIQVIIEFLIWGLTSMSGDIMAFMCYWDGPNYVYAAKTNYKIPEDNPWTRTFKYPPFYFACHLPGYPLLIKVLSILCFNTYWLGYILSMLFGSSMVIYVFRRLLRIYDCVVDPTYSAYLLYIIPLRFTLYKAVGASEPLFLIYCYLSLIFFKTDQMIFLLLSMWGACITRIEGMAIVGTVGLSYLLRFDIPRALFCALGFLGTYFVALLHYIRFNSYTAYLEFNKNTAGLLRFPLYGFVIPAGYHKYVIQSYMLFSVITPLLAGTLVLYTVAVPLAIFCTVYAIYITVLFHADLFRYSIPGYTLAVIIGFDPIFSSPIFKQRMIYTVPFLIILMFTYYYGQINSNKAIQTFLLEVFNPKKYHFDNENYRLVSH